MSQSGARRYRTDRRRHTSQYTLGYAAAVSGLLPPRPAPSPPQRPYRPTLAATASPCHRAHSGLCLCKASFSLIAANSFWIRASSTFH